jgi:hypothetical protein
MSNLQPGNLALITNHKAPSNIGCCVFLIRFVLENEIFRVPTLGDVINKTGYSGWLVAGRVSVESYNPEQHETGYQLGFCICKSEHLMLIDETDPDKTTIETDTNSDHHPTQ